MKGKDRIINEMVQNAADILEAKFEFNELYAQQMDAREQFEVADSLRQQNARIIAAIEVIRANAGCWA